MLVISKTVYSAPLTGVFYINMIFSKLKSEHNFLVILDVSKNIIPKELMTFDQRLSFTINLNLEGAVIGTSDRRPNDCSLQLQIDCKAQSLIKHHWLLFEICSLTLQLFPKNLAPILDLEKITL